MSFELDMHAVGEGQSSGDAITLRFGTLGTLQQRVVVVDGGYKADGERLVDFIPRPTHTVTTDNGTEFHGYKTIEAATGSRFYFATPYHSWERGTSENTNGLIRQYLPKRKSMALINQRHCNRIALRLNNRPRKRLGFLTPKECYELNSYT